MKRPLAATVVRFSMPKGGNRMNERWLTIGAIALMGVAVTVACTGDQGPPGPAGANGEAGAPGSGGGRGEGGSPGSPGTAGAAAEAGPPGPQGPQGEAGPAIVISAGAKHGVDISPVPLALDGLTADQIEQ